MKALIQTIIAAAFSLTGIAQTTSGTITYKETVKLDIQLEGEMAQFADMIPKEHSSVKILQFTPEASVYTAAPKKEEPANAGGGNMRIIMNSSTPEEIVYRDIKESKTVSQKEFMTRKFLVTGAPKKYNWKMTGQQKTILGYACQQAKAEVDSDQVIAWFTPAIPVATGPGESAGLPGLILEITRGENYSIVATDIKPGEVDKKALVKPSGGKKMTREEYTAMVEEKAREMQEEMGGQGGGNNIMIRVQR